jgi:hypothetical protein
MTAAQVMEELKKKGSESVEKNIFESWCQSKLNQSEMVM